jgi:MFS family permease
MVGRLSDIIGRRYFLLGGQTIGLVGALVCATAESVNVLIGGTVLVGLSAAAQLTFTFVVQELVPNRHRALTQAVMVCANFAFAGLGPVIARLLVENTKLGWRYVWITVIICVKLKVVDGATISTQSAVVFP